MIFGSIGFFLEIFLKKKVVVFLLWKILWEYKLEEVIRSLILWGSLVVMWMYFEIFVIFLG